jgi:hypothetical protein
MNHIRFCLYAIPPSAWQADDNKQQRVDLRKGRVLAAASFLVRRPLLSSAEPEPVQQ